MINRLGVYFGCAGSCIFATLSITQKYHNEREIINDLESINDGYQQKLTKLNSIPRSFNKKANLLGFANHENAELQNMYARLIKEIRFYEIDQEKYYFDLNNLHNNHIYDISRYVLDVENKNKNVTNIRIIYSLLAGVMAVIALKCR